MCDITGKSSYPTRSDGPSAYGTAASSSSGPGLNSGAGFLTYMFEADETVNLDLGIAYAYTGATNSIFLDLCIFFDFDSIFFSGSDRNVRNNASLDVVSHNNCTPCSCGVHSARTGARPYQVHHLPAENVLISIGWWLVENPMLGGVLRVCRLKIPSGVLLGSSSAVSSVSRNVASLQHVVPLPITTTALILDEKDIPSSNRRVEQRKASESCNCALCGYLSTKHWGDEDLTEAEKVLFANLSSGTPASYTNSVNSTCSVANRQSVSTNTKTIVEKRERPPKMNVVAGVEKKQKVVRPDRLKDESEDLPLSRDSSFIASSPGDFVGEEDDQEVGPMNLSGEAEDGPADSTSAARGKYIRPAASGPIASTELSTAKELRLELDRLRVENRRLQDDTDLTMRKADRRFEMEMAARRFWKQEKNKLEDVISQLLKDQQRFSTEREKVKRVHELLQSVLETASSTLQYTDEAGDALMQQQGRAAGTSVPVDVQLQSPASKLQFDLAEVAQAHGSNTFTGATSSRPNRSAASTRSSRGVDDSAQQANFARKPFFCIVCLEHTARVAIQPCGHICFCADHAQEMERRRQDHHHSKCPLCQSKIESFLTIQGIDI